MPDIKGLIYANFAPHEKCKKMFYTLENAKKADAIRQFIEKLFQEKEIDECEYRFLIASLLTSTDKVANTTSVYVAHLKKFSSGSLKPLVLRPIHQKREIINKNENIVFNDYAENVVKNNKFDVVYLDPPYVARQIRRLLLPSKLYCKITIQLLK